MALQRLHYTRRRTLMEMPVLRAFSPCALGHNILFQRTPFTSRGGDGRRRWAQAPSTPAGSASWTWPPLLPPATSAPLSVSGSQLFGEVSGCQKERLYEKWCLLWFTCNSKKYQRAEQFSLERGNQGRNEQIREAIRRWAGSLPASGLTGPLSPTTSPWPPQASVGT